MLSAESQVDVILGVGKNTGVTSLLLISVRSLGSYPADSYGSSNGPKVATFCGLSQWSSPCEKNNQGVRFEVRVDCAEEVKQGGNNNDCA